ncbi:MAG: extracellular solute-binding protein [Dehalococcoidia bacterium]|nr:extracellular solute-binding protein [Dehalococcoidia bacterium]
MGDLGSENLNRRQFLRLAGLTAAGIGLAACTPAAAPTPAPTKAAVAPTAADVTAQLYEAAKKEGTVMTYGTGSASDWQQIADAFMKKYPGIKVDFFTGSNEAIVDKVLTEARAQKPICDMIFRINYSDVYSLSKEAVLDNYLSTELKNFDKAAYEAQGLYTVVDYIYEVLEYNTKALSAAQAPKSYADLLKPEFAGKLGLEASAVPWFTGMLRIMGADKGMAYMKSLAAQKPRLVSGHTTLHKFIVSGEIPVAIYMHHFLPIADKAAGQPIEWVDPVEVTPTQAIVTSLVKKCPHPNAAKLLTDYVLSDEAAKIMVTRGWLPARKGVDLGIVAPIAKVEALLLNDVSFGKETVDNQKAFTDTFGKAA